MCIEFHQTWSEASLSSKEDIYNKILKKYFFNFPVFWPETGLCFFLAHLAKGQGELLPSLCVRPSVVNFLHFDLLLKNRWVDLNQTWQRCSLWGADQVLLLWCPTAIKHGRQGPDWSKLWQSSSWEPLIQMKVNLTQRFLMRYLPSVVTLVPIRHPTWLSGARLRLA